MLFWVCVFQKLSFVQEKSAWITNFCTQSVKANLIMLLQWQGYTVSARNEENETKPMD